MTREELYRTIDFCNGEIRIMAARYEPGWYCLIATDEVGDEIWEKWEDLVGWDNNYFESERFFDGGHESLFLARGDTPDAAFEAAIVMATRGPASASEA